MTELSRHAGGAAESPSHLEQRAIELAERLGVKEYGPLTRNWSFTLDQLASFYGAALVSGSEMALLPIGMMPEDLKNGRGLMLYGRHADDSGREGSFRKGDHWWAIAVWDIWRPKTHAPRWVYALSGEPLTWGEPTHYCELKPP